MASTEDSELSRLEEAALWLERLESGRGGLEAFERWRADPANALAFAKISASSQWLSQSAPLHTRKAPDRMVSRRWWATGAAAAVAILAVGAVSFAVDSSRAEAKTAIGERSSLSLPDGGRIDINTDSKVSWRFDRGRRDVWLERGEIGLSVADDGRPFSVHVGGQKLRLRPGSYNIRRFGEAAALTVENGLGQVIAPGGAEVKITSGNAAEISAKQVAARAVKPFEIEVVSAWRNDEIVFDGVPLAQAVSEYNRYLTQKIVVSDPTIERTQLGGRFTTKDPAAFLEGLKASFGIHVRRGDDRTIYLSG